MTTKWCVNVDISIVGLTEAEKMKTGISTYTPISSPSSKSNHQMMGTRITQDHQCREQDNCEVTHARATPEKPVAECQARRTWDPPSSNVKMCGENGPLRVIGEWLSSLGECKGSTLRKDHSVWQYIFSLPSWGVIGRWSLKSANSSWQTCTLPL